jgi:outer membrane lipoprotein-sorting protein
MPFLAFPMLQFARNLPRFTYQRSMLSKNSGKLACSHGTLTMCVLLVCLLSTGWLARAQDAKNPTAEMLAEGVIITNGGRAALTQIRRNGVEHGKIVRVLPDGHVEEGRYDLKFVRGATAAKDKVRMDRKTPQTEYSLVYGEGKLFGIINGSQFTPRPEATADFNSERVHSIDALLRYKENESKLALVGKEKHQGIDVFIIDLTDKDKNRTRYYISAKTVRVLWLEYEETPAGATAPVKYVRRFYDYRVAQNAWIPFRTVLTADGKQTEETRILTVTFGVKMEDSVFQSPDQAASANP